MTILDWLTARRFPIGLSLCLIAAVGAWFGPWPALGVAGVLLAWPR